MSARPLFPLLLLGLLIGCSDTRSGQLILKPVDGSKKFSQKFERAYSMRSGDGAYDFVLLAEDQPLKQIVHVRVPWMPERGNISEVIVSNAAVDWYILSSANGQDVIQYAGAGHAMAYASDKTIDLNLKTARLKPHVRPRRAGRSAGDV
jgi:hypothetical protein